MSADWTWTDAAWLCVEGRGWPDTEGPYDRLPARAKAQVRDAVWSLSRCPTGVTVRFETDARELRARWRLAEATLSGVNLPALAHSGLDLYGQAGDGSWRWLGVTRELAGAEAESPFLTAPLDGRRRQCKVYLSTFNPVLRLAIGVPKGSTVRIVSPRPEKPVAYYGTSIVHGAGVSRPGMTHVAILGRRLDYPVLNLGFSGNALMEPEVAELLAELDPAVYLLDALPNMGAALVEERAEAFVLRLHEARPRTPIVLVEDRTYPAGWACPSQAAENLSRRAAYKQVFGRLLGAGVGPLYYLEGDGLLGTDGDGTNDGSHTNDLGASRMADALVPVLRRILFGL